MEQSEWKRILDEVTPILQRYLDSLPDRSVYRPADPGEIRALLGGPLPVEPTPAAEVVAALGKDLEPYVTAHASGRFYGFVIGGLHPASFGAEMLLAGWD